MSDLFQYAILQYMHDPITRESLNIGVVVYAESERRLLHMINSRYGRLSNAFGKIDRDNYVRMIRSLEKSLNGLGKQIQTPSFFEERQSIADLLTTVLPVDNSSLEFGLFGAGLAHDLEQELEQLFLRFVEKYEERPRTERRKDEDVRRHYARIFAQYDLDEYLQPRELGTENYKFKFEYAYKNEKWHPLEAVSFDLMDGNYILEKSARWVGRAAMLNDSDEIGTMYFLLGKPGDPTLFDKYRLAAENLRTKIKNARIVEEEEAKDFAAELSAFIHAHQTPVEN